MRALWLAALAVLAPRAAQADTMMMGGMLGPYPMTQDASGTAWQPAGAPMPGLMWASGAWSGMAHGQILVVADHQSGPRGDDTVFSESMAMITAQHGAGPGTLTLKAMASLDPAMGARGYPLLLQTGETADGIAPLVDRQHPHNLLMELGAVWQVPLGSGIAGFVYAADPGEPALGPVTFMHRFSGADDPAAPISHHWLDSTHVTFGVVTAGLVVRRWKIEASAFNGREPDQHRWGYQPFALDSWSARLSFNPDAHWSLQASYGWLHSPEALESTVNQRRLTASATYDRRLGSGHWQATLAWGRIANRPGRTLSAVLGEAALALGPTTLFARAEWVQKDDLAPGTVTKVGEATLGAVHDIALAPHLALGFGLAATLNRVPQALRAAYGAQDPAGVMPFVRLKLL